MSSGPGSAGEESRVARQDVEALLEIRRELGPTYDAALVNSFAERIERAVADRVDTEVARREGAGRRRRC